MFFLDINADANSEHIATPPTVVKKQKKSNPFKFNRSDTKSSKCPVYYFKHQDTDTEQQMVSGTSETEDKSLDETSEEEWTYTAGNENSNNEDSLPPERPVKTKLNFSNDNIPAIMTTSSETITKSTFEPKNQELSKEWDPALYYENIRLTNPDYILCPSVFEKQNIKHLVNEAEEMVQKMAKEQFTKELIEVLPKKSEPQRNFKPLNFGTKNIHSQAKISRIKEWLKQNNPNLDNQQVLLLHLSIIHSQIIKFNYFSFVIY